MSNRIAMLKREDGIGRPLDLLHSSVTEGLPSCYSGARQEDNKKLQKIGVRGHECSILPLMIYGKSTHSAPRSEARRMPFDRLKATSKTEGLRVDTALR
jgi:hypothetical protein